MAVDVASETHGMPAPAGDSVSVRERMLQLKSLPVMGQLGSADLSFLARHASELRVPAGVTVLRRGEVAQRVFLMTRGAVELRVGDEVRDRLEAPASVGVVPMWADRAPPYDAVTTEPSLLLDVPNEVMFGFFENHPVMLANITAGIATGLLHMQGGLPLDDSANGPPMGDRPAGPLNFVERLLLLRDTDFFADANIDALGELARHQIEQRFEPGEDLWRQGDPATHSLRIVYGNVRTERDGRVARIGAGHRLGGLDSIATQARSYTATAETEVIGIVEKASVMSGVIEEQPELARRLLGRMASAMLDAQGFRIAGDAQWTPLRPQLGAGRRRAK